MTQHDKALAFQALHKQPGCFVMPNAWDAGSAFLLENLCFKAIATTSAGLAFALRNASDSRWTISFGVAAGTTRHSHV